MDKLTLTSISAQVILDSAIKKGIRIEIISHRFNLLKIYYKNKFFFIKSTSFSVNPQPSCTIANNKFLTKKILQHDNIPMPKGWLVRTQSEAKKLMFEKKLFPCVLKPARGAHGRNVYANIVNMAEFNRLLPLVFAGHGIKNVLIEEYVPGRDYRLLVVNDRVSAVLERIPAHVIGDGRSTIRHLIKQFNLDPRVGKKYEKPLCKIVFDKEVARNLRKLGLKLTSVPKLSETVFLRQNANISTGGISRDATDEVCQKVKDIAVAATRSIGMVISGVDIIYNDITKQAFVLELNDTPGIDIHHYPVYGQSRPVADDIIDFLCHT